MPRVCSPLILSSLLFAVSALAAPAPSRPQLATVYRDGSALLEETLPAGALTEGVRLPAEADPASVRLLADGRPLAGALIQPIDEDASQTEKTFVNGVVVERQSVAKQRVGFAVRAAPGQGQRGPLTLRYGVSGLSWQPQLDADVRDAKRVQLSLTALVSNGVLDLSDCRLRLASSAGPLPQKALYGLARGPGAVNGRAAEQVYDLGRRSLPKGGQAVLTVATAQGAYEHKLFWYTGGQERVREALLIDNPLPQAICPTAVRVFRDGALLAEDQAEWTPPKERLILAAGHTAAIGVERSVETTENLANKARPFRHQLTFSVTNAGPSAVHLEVIMPKKIGARHKTLYKFGREPDRRPGAFFIWETTLRPDASETISLRLDSEYARFGEYQSYEKARYEMF